jgi:hypothetical protein
MTRRIGRGLLRLWLVVSIVWIGAIGTLTWSTLTPVVTGMSDAEFAEYNPPQKKPVAGMFDDLIPQAAPKPPFDPTKPYQVWPGTPVFSAAEFSVVKRHEEIKTGVEVALIPPMVLLMLGLAGGWVVRGFRN